MPKLRLAKTLLILLYFAGEIAQAQELQDGFVPISGLGMGGAFTAVANDENAMWSNPAGIARVRKARSRATVNLTSFPNLVLGVNKESQGFYSQLQKTGSKNAEAVVAELDSLSDKPFWVRAAMFPYIMMEVGNNLPAAFGIFSDTISKASISAEDTSQTRIEVTSDSGAILGMTFTSKSNRVNLGLQLRPTYRYAYEDSIPTSSLLDQSDLKKRITEEANKTTGLGVDMGFLFTFADFWFPTLGIALRNLPTGCQKDYLNPHTKLRQSICGTMFSGKVGNEDALSIVDPTDLRVGMSITPRFSREINLRLAVDMHHIYLTDGTNFYGLPGIESRKLLHAGAELFFGNPLLPPEFAIRGGMNQSFSTLGVTARMGVFAIDFASYSADLSATAAAQEDRRFVLGLSMRI